MSLYISKTEYEVTVDGVFVFQKKKKKKKSSAVKDSCMICLKVLVMSLTNILILILDDVASQILIL
jgi:hypothetical protein